MKHQNRIISSLAIALLLLQPALVGSLTHGQNDRGKTHQISSQKNEHDKQLAELIQRFTNRSSDGLTETVKNDGSVSVDLEGRFQNLMLSRLNERGEPIAACVTSIAEANDFLGRDLHSGERFSRTSFLFEDLETIASRHGMTAAEYLFYSKLISEHTLQQAMMAPSSANIVISNSDGAGEGFNEATAAFVVGEGGNMGLTRGQQRLNVFNFAASIWGAFLDSSVPITVNSQFNPLTPCTSSGGVLGSAGTTTVHRDYAGAGVAGTWHSQALANKQNGADQSANPDINATFNVSVDSSCLGGSSRFYYGLDNVTPSARINLLVVVLHEIGHGLGFQSFVNGSTGALFNSFPDIYLRNMIDQSTGLYWNQMTNAERQASAINNGNVFWDGASVRLESGFLTAGRNAANGRVQLHTPTTFAGGSSISHFSTAASPNLLMEPSINVGLPIDLDLTRQQMRDIGWFRDSTNDNVPDTIINVTPNNGLVFIGDNVNVSWTNTGSFNRNVNVEYSSDGGATFATLAANIVNTGSYTWNVSQSPTTGARIRIRENGFASPAGVSSANFTVSFAPSSANVSVGGRVATASGMGISGATVRFLHADGTVFVGRTNAFGYFYVEGLQAGGVYIVETSAKRHSFETRTLNAVEDIVGFDITALE